MIYEQYYEMRKNSRGQVSRVFHYVGDDIESIDELPKSAPVGSDIIAGDRVFVMLPSGWREL